MGSHMVREIILIWYWRGGRGGGGGGGGVLDSREASSNFFPGVLSDIWLVPDGTNLPNW